MKITKVTPMTMGTDWRNITFVKVETDEGLTGVADVRALNRTETVVGYLSESVPRYVLGADPFEIESLVHRMSLQDFGRAGEVVMTGVALIEIACWDIVGQALGQPVYRLLGGAVRDKIKAYANGWYTVERTPDEFHAAATRVVERGYLALKFDPFGAGFYEIERAEKRRVVSLVEAVRDAVGPDVDILIEMHGRFNPVTAIEMANELAPFKPSWYEEPTPPENLAALKKVADAIAPLGIPIATGERLHTPFEYRELFELQAADIIQTDITHFGGILNTKKLAAWANAYYMLIAPHNVGGPVSTAAALHLAASTPNFKIQEYFNDFAESYVQEAATGLPKVVDGYFALPEGPGLGLTLNEDVIEAHPQPRCPLQPLRRGLAQTQRLTAVRQSPLIHGSTQPGLPMGTRLSHANADRLRSLCVQLGLHHETIVVHHEHPIKSRQHEQQHNSDLADSEHAQRGHADQPHCIHRMTAGQDRPVARSNEPRPGHGQQVTDTRTARWSRPRQAPANSQIEQATSPEIHAPGGTPVRSAAQRTGESQTAGLGVRWASTTGRMHAASGAVTPAARLPHRPADPPVRPTPARPAAPQPLAQATPNRERPAQPQAHTQQQTQGRRQSPTASSPTSGGRSRARN